MNTIGVAAAHTVAERSSPWEVRTAPWGEPKVERWPGWARLMILLGSSAVLWAGIVWTAIQLAKLA